MTDPSVRDEIRGVLPRLTFTPLDPQGDAPLVHRWVGQPRARFWMMGDLTLQEVREVYEWIDARTTHHAWIVRCDGVPCAIFQTYEPAADPVGEAYPVRPGDLGIHALLGPDPVAGAPRLSTAVAVAAFSRCFADRCVRRLVAEPDARNAAAVRRLELLGFELGEVVDLPHKRARLAFLPREGFARVLGTPAPPPDLP